MPFDVDANDLIATPLPDDATYFQILIDPRTTTAAAKDVHVSFTANHMALDSPDILGITWLSGGGPNFNDWTQPQMNIVNNPTGITVPGPGGMSNIAYRNIQFKETYDVTLDKLPVDPTSKCYILKIPYLDPNDSSKSLAGSGHLTITLNAPAVMQINTNGDGTYSFALPSPALDGAGYQNRWDFVEFNCATPSVNGKPVCFCNTTNVDFFSLGQTIKGRDASGNIETFGIDLNTKDPVTTVIANLNALSADYTAGYTTVNDTFVRFMAPDLAFTSKTTVLDSAINAGYKQYETAPLSFNVGTTAYTAKTVSDSLVFTEPEAITIAKPSTMDVIASTGPLDTGTTTDANVQGAMKFMDAALNRGIFGNTANWLTPSAYYPAGGTYNEYSNCLHNAFIDKACYGFSFDDVPGDNVLSVPAIGTCTSMTLVLSDS